MARADAIARERAGRGGRAARDRRPCCSARPPPASTCSWTTRRAGGPSRRRSPGRRTPREGPMNVAPPIRRFGRPGQPEPSARQTTDDRRAANRTPVKAPAQVLQRERHEPDYLILVVVVALAADRHPDGLLVVGDARLPDATTTRSRWSGRRSSGRSLGLVAMVVMMRLDYRYLRLVSVPLLPRRGRSCSCSCSCPIGSISRRSAARRAGSRSAAAGHPPGRDRQAGARRLPRPLAGQRGAQDRAAFWRGHAAVPGHRRPRSSRSCSWSPTWARPAS